jgi:hypothetical protein
VIINKATGETLTVVSQFDLASNDGSNGDPGGGIGVEALAFADGTLWKAQQILDHSVYVASPGSNTISNLRFGDGDIPILASPGVTSLDGLSNANDTYIWQPGDGNDTIYDGEDLAGHTDRLELRGVRTSDISLSRSGLDLVVTDSVSGESITVSGQMSGNGQGIEQIVFDDGTVWTRDQVLDLVPTQIPDGTQTYFEGYGDTTIRAGYGDDTFYGNGDTTTFTYRRGDGNDTLNVFCGDVDVESDFGHDHAEAGWHQPR